MRNGASLSEVAKKVGMSHNFLSEVERGKKMPSDERIRALANYYEEDEDILFRLADKIPLRIREELEESPTLQKLIATLDKKALKDEERERLYERLLRHLDEL